MEMWGTGGKWLFFTESVNSTPIYVTNLKIRRYLVVLVWELATVPEFMFVLNVWFPGDYPDL